jgi:hypothetical protein
MTQGLVCIALAAAHLEAQQVNGGIGTIPASLPMTSTDQPISQKSYLADKSESGLVVRMVSNASDSSDEDAIQDPEEILARILQEQPKDVPPPPSADEVITTVQMDDVLCGRGGETNHHPGNVQYRGLVKKYQRLYLKAKRRDKPKIARLIVDTVRRRTGRFLKKDPASGVWKDVGNNKAREKTSQALREGAPEIRDHEYPNVLHPQKRKVSLTCSQSSSPTFSDQTETHGIRTMNDSNATPISFEGSLSSSSSVGEISDATTLLTTTLTDIVNTGYSKDWTCQPSKKPKIQNLPTDRNASGLVEEIKGVGGPRLKFLKSRLSMGNPLATVLQEEIV